MTLGGRRFLLGCAVVAAAACLALAVSLPFVRLTRPALFAYGHSLISGVSALAEAGQLPLAGVVLVLAIFLPLIKLLYLVLLATLPSEELGRSATQLRAIDWLGRWSPHDILAVGMALILMLGHDATAQRSGGGALLFAGAVLAMLLAYAWLRGDASARRMRAPAMRAAYATALRGLPFGALLALAAITFVLGVSLQQARQALESLDQEALGALGIGSGTDAPPLPMRAVPKKPTIRAVMKKDRLRMTPAAKRVLEEAVKPMRRKTQVTAQQVLAQILTLEPPDPAAVLLGALGVNTSEVRRRLDAVTPGS